MTDNPDRSDSVVIEFPAGRRRDGSSRRIAPRVRRLPSITFERVGAPVDLFLEAFVATGLEVDRRSQSSRVIAVTRRALWHRYQTTELIELGEGQLRSQWVSGPLGFVEERLEAVESSPGEIEFRYRGSFDAGRGPLAGVRALIFSRALRRDAGRRVAQAKRLAEGRFALAAARTSGHPSGRSRSRRRGPQDRRRLTLVRVDDGPDRGPTIA